MIRSKLVLLLAGAAIMPTVPLAAATTDALAADAAATGAAVTDLAADAPPAGRGPGADAAAGQPGEILVTARRRAEAIQDVPLAISAFQGETLAATGSYNVARLTQLQPSLQFYSTNPRNTTINIRGIGVPLGLTNDGIEQGVGVYIDQVFYSRVAATSLDFVDIERIEVLRGPQGTLYGKNTTAGAINITTREPSFDFEGQTELTIGNYDFKQGKGSISGPLTDNLAARVSIATTDRRGTIRNVRTGQNVNALDNLGLRGTVLWKPTDTLRLFLSGDYNVQDPICCAQIYVRYGPTQRAANRQYPALVALYNSRNPASPYAVPSTDAFDRLTDLDAQLRARNEHGGVSLRAEWEVGAGTLTSVSAYRYWDWNPSNDRDFTGLSINPKVNNPTMQKQYTQEFRYAYGRDRFDLVIGAFGFHQKIRTSGIQTYGRDASLWLLAPSASPTALANIPAVLDGLQADNDIRLDNTSVAAFGKLTWKVTDAFSIAPGIRINYDKKDGYYNSVVTGTASTGGRRVVTFADTDPWIVAQRGVQAPQFFEADYSDWNLSYDLTLSYDFGRDVLAYATYARSFKSGGVNLNGVPNNAVGVPQTQVAVVDPEKVDHFEIGLKTQFWDRRVTFNLTGFWTEIRDYQAIVNDGSTSVLRGYLANADKVRTRGIEAEVSIRPSDRFNAYASGALTDPEYRSFANAPCAPELSGGTLAGANQTPGAAGVPGALSPAVCDISGQLLPGVSRRALSYGAEGNVPATLFGRAGEAYVGIDGSYRSTFSSNASRSIYTDIRGYSVNNLRAGWRDEDGINVFGWVRNVFDKDYFEVLATTPGNTGLVSGQPADPRTYGLTLALRF